MRLMAPLHYFMWQKAKITNHGYWRSLHGNKIKNDIDDYSLRNCPNQINCHLAMEHAKVLGLGARRVVREVDCLLSRNSTSFAIKNPHQSLVQMINMYNSFQTGQVDIFPIQGLWCHKNYGLLCYNAHFVSLQKSNHMLVVHEGIGVMLNWP